MAGTVAIFKYIFSAPEIETSHEMLASERRNRFSSNGEWDAIDEFLRKRGEGGLTSFIKYPLEISSLLDTLPKASDPLPKGNLMATLELCCAVILILETGKRKLCETFATLFQHAGSY